MATGTAFPPSNDVLGGTVIVDASSDWKAAALTP
jgi:hypothetical protein